jgi:CHAD domain-containing protein
MSARARLQLVVAAPPDLGPISPELALVSPELAEAARAQLPDPPWQRPDEAARGSKREPMRPVLMTTLFAATTPKPSPKPSGRATGFFDTADRRLKRHDISLERSEAGGTARWRVVLTRGEVVEADEERGGEPPLSITALVSAVVGGEALIPVPWHADDADVTHFQAQIWEQRRALLRHDPGTRLGTDDENLHQFRVASRRLRAFLRVGRGLVDDDWSAAVRAGLSELAGAGGPVRDLDVLLARLRDEIADLDAAQLPAAETLLAGLDAERDRLRGELRAALDRPEYTELLERLATPAPVGPQPVRFRLRKLARKELRRLVRDVRRLGDTPSDTDLHALRIRVKRARYAAELAGGSAPEAESLIESAKSLQDILGEHQDTVVAERLLFEQAARARDSAVAFVAGRLAEREHVRRGRLRERLPSAWRQLRRAARRF